MVGAQPHLPYLDRIEILNSYGIALWDVLKSCQRTTSLDADIEKSSMVVNDFPHFFASHPQIQYVFFNGSTADQTFRKRVLPHIEKPILQLHRLPSSSPAHASLSFQDKLKSWQCILATPFTQNVKPSASDI